MAIRVSNQRAITKMWKSWPAFRTSVRSHNSSGSVSQWSLWTAATCVPAASRGSPNSRSSRKSPTTGTCRFFCWRTARLRTQPGTQLRTRSKDEGRRTKDTRDLFLDLRLSFAYSARNVRRDGPMLPLTKRQREILDYLNEFIQQHGYAPSLEEIGRRFGLSSLATVHKHLTNLQEKGFIKRAWNRSRSVEMVPTRTGGRAVELPLLGYVAAGQPIEAIASTETIAVPEDLVGKRDTYVLRVKGNSMIDEQICDGDLVIVEDRKTAQNGETVVALLGGSDVTLKKLY